MVGSRTRPWNWLACGLMLAALLSLGFGLTSVAAMPGRLLLPLISRQSGLPAIGPAAVLQIGHLKYDGSDEWVRIDNIGANAQHMTGWTLVSVIGPQTYAFPSGYLLSAGASVYLHSGPDADEDPPTHLLWSPSYIWNNAGDEARLYDEQGQEVDRLTY
ncbi:MAG: lamin tail domain-containing protein [Chloroflexi bacterium]|nr:lamin tail domain-containing protein [Chloroflexota bacterium]